MTEREIDNFDCDQCGENCDDVNTVEHGRTFVCNDCLALYCTQCDEHNENCTCEPEHIDWKRIDDKQRI